MSARQSLNACRIVELGPFRAQRRHRIALAPNLETQLGDALRLPGRLELDRVDIGGRQHERADYKDIEHAHHGCRPVPSRAANSGDGGSRGGKGATPWPALAASVRSAARSLAERARGLALISASVGVIGRFVSTRKVAAAGVGAG